MTWTTQVVGALTESKTLGLPFDAAWALAVRQHPPRLIELGVRSREESLLDQAAADALEWWRGICEAAYENRPAPDGRPSRLRGLRAALEIELAVSPMSTGRRPNRPVAA